MARTFSLKSSPWWWLSKKQKRELQRKRLEGMFGGANAAGAGRAPYFWPQSGLDPEAAALADIDVRMDVPRAIASFDEQIDEIRKSYFAVA